jgi:hypothetical protein
VLALSLVAAALYPVVTTTKREKPLRPDRLLTEGDQ